MMIRHRALLICVLTTLAVPAVADRIHFKHGDYLDVDASREDRDRIIYKRFGGEIGVSKSDIARIEQLSTDPTEWQAPGSSKNPSRPGSMSEPVPAAPVSGTSVSGASRTSGKTWTPEPRPTLPPPPVGDTSKVMLANYWERQKQLALERMDYHASAKRTCVSRYRTPSVIKGCETGSDDSRRFWNERYILATREYERYR